MTHAGRRGNKSRKKWPLLLFVVVVFSVIIALGLHQSQPSAKKEAAEYFQIINPTVNMGEFVPAGSTFYNSTGLKLTGLGFTLKTVGGDAHNVVVYGLGTGESARWDVALIEKDEVGIENYVELTSDTAYFSKRTTDGSSTWYPVVIRISSDEADGKITIRLTE